MSNNIKEQSGEQLELILFPQEGQNEVVNSPTDALNIPLHIIQCTRLLGDIDKTVPNIKCFYMAGGVVALGIVLVETGDSFLVSLPVKLIMGQSGSMKAEPISSEIISRIFKTSVIRLTEVLPSGRVAYYEYLLENGSKYLPDYLTKKMMDSMSDFVLEYQEQAIEEVSGTKGIPGVSPHAFRVSHITNTSIH